MRVLQNGCSILRCPPTPTSCIWWCTPTVMFKTNTGSEHLQNIRQVWWGVLSMQWSIPTKKRAPPTDRITVTQAHWCSWKHHPLHSCFLFTGDHRTLRVGPQRVKAVLDLSQHWAGGFKCRGWSEWAGQYTTFLFKTKYLKTRGQRYGWWLRLRLAATAVKLNKTRALNSSNKPSPGFYCTKTGIQA